MKYVDPTEMRIARDDAERKRLREKPKGSNAEAYAKSAFKEASGKGKGGAMKTTEAVYKASAKHPRKVL